MITYYMDLALRSMRRNKVLTALMVVAIGLGIGASMTMLTVLHVLTADPIPGKSAQLFAPQVDPRPLDGYHEGVQPPDELTWIDAMNLLHARKGVLQTAMMGGYLTVIPPTGVQHAFHTQGRYATADFFRMFDVPFIAGSGWSARQDDNQARVAVITRHMADRLYGTTQAVGRTVRMANYEFRVIGVIGDWDPSPRFFDPGTGLYGKPEQVYLPLQTVMGLKPSLPTMGNMDCWGNLSTAGLTQSTACAWIKFWVQLDTPEQAARYRQFLVHYSAQQKALGRFQRPPNTRLRDVMQWLDYIHAVPGSVQLQALLALGFLLVCLVNTTALLLVKFLRRGGELSVRRAMGASRRTIFAQLLTEAALLGLAGGLLGLGLAAFGLWIVREQPVQYASLAHLDGGMLAATFFLAVVAMLVAALFPAWRACRLLPARLLKTQ
jgi:putative ABC transport system permease protein